MSLGTLRSEGGGTAMASAANIQTIAVLVEKEHH